MTSEPSRPEHFPLRLFLVVDATLLLVLGLAMVAAPERIAMVFAVGALPMIASFIIGLLGCAFISMGVGNAIAASDPVRHISWVWAGIARSGAEVIFGTICILRGIATFRQAGFCIVSALIVAAVFLVLFPKR